MTVGDRRILRKTILRNKYFRDSKTRQSCGWMTSKHFCLECCGFCQNPCDSPRCWSFDFINQCHGRVTKNLGMWAKILGIDVYFNPDLRKGRRKVNE